MVAVAKYFLFLSTDSRKLGGGNSGMESFGSGSNLSVVVVEGMGIHFVGDLDL